MSSQAPPLLFQPVSYSPIETRLAAMRTAIAAGADPNELDGKLKIGRPLNYAICDSAFVDYNQLKQNLPIVELLLEAGAEPRLGSWRPHAKSPIQELEAWFREYEIHKGDWAEEDLQLYEFYERALSAIKEVAEKLDAKDAAEAARKAKSEGSWFSRLKLW